MGVLALGHDTVCFVSLELGALVLSLCLFFVMNLLSSWWTGVDVVLAPILARLRLGAVAPWFLADFHQFCVVAERALG